MEIKETKIENGCAYISVKVDQKQVDEQKEHVIGELISEVTVKGFRQGKAPKSIASEYVNPDKLADNVMNHILSEALEKIMAEYKYHLLGRPVLDNIDTKDKTGGWNVQILFPLYPEVKLGDYKKLLKKKPAKTTKTATEETKKDNKEEALESIYKTLIEKIDLVIPQPVIDEEVNYSLKRVADQAKTLNLTLESYLKAVNKNLDQIKKEYAEKAVEALKLDLILLAIAKEEKIDTDKKELQEFAKVSNIPESQVDQLKSVMDRRKTIEFLQTL
jgi:FKBP-type peptidyl-prolyl cis-trans isomerase (trigger factor)